METRHRLFRDRYWGSVSLMRLSARLAERPGVSEASAIMATEGNLELLRDAGLLDGDVGAEPNSLVVVVQGQGDALEAAMDEAESALKQQPIEKTGDAVSGSPAPHSIESGLVELAAANLAVISTPGTYAAAEALKAVRLGLNAMLFSDNVGLDDEIMLKRYARERDLLVMGPDCDSAIINGIPLGFANRVRRGEIGVVAASGTGLQQVTCLVDRWGQGISQAIGTGGRDLHARVGGITMLQGLAALAADAATRVIILISKPPAAEVAAKVIEEGALAGKPVVVNFIGATGESLVREGVTAARTLEDAAAAAVALSEDRPPPSAEGPATEEISTAAGCLAPGQRYVHGLFGGGTFGFEALHMLSEALGPVYSPTPLDDRFRLTNIWRSRGHTVVDFGADAFTQGRPHPMIDHRLRNERLLQEAADGEVAVILFDVVLGHGAHSDPAAEIVTALSIVAARAVDGGTRPVFVASVCGTEDDPQGLARQEPGSCWPPATPGRCASRRPEGRFRNGGRRDAHVVRGKIADHQRRCTRLRRGGTVRRRRGPRP